MFTTWFRFIWVQLRFVNVIFFICSTTSVCIPTWVFMISLIKQDCLCFMYILHLFLSWSFGNGLNLYIVHPSFLLIVWGYCRCLTHFELWVKLLPICEMGRGCDVFHFYFCVHHIDVFILKPNWYELDMCFDGVFVDLEKLVYELHAPNLRAWSIGFFWNLVFRLGMLIMLLDRGLVKRLMLFVLLCLWDWYEMFTNCFVLIGVSISNRWSKILLPATFSLAICEFVA